MPISKDVDTTAAKVVKGDYIRVIADSAHNVLVDSVKVGTKWTEAREANGKLIFRRENDAQTWVIRDVPTEEEIRAKAEADSIKAAAFREELLNRMVDRMSTGVEKIRNDIRTALDTGQSVNVDLFEELAIEEEYALLARGIQTIIENNPGMSGIAAVAQAVERVKEGLISGYNEPTQSGGFTFRNAKTQAQIVARRKFVQGHTWGML